jgi:hypothetical protein
MRWKNTYLNGLIPFVVLPLVLGGCQRSITGPEDIPGPEIEANGDLVHPSLEPAFEISEPRLLLAPGAAELAVGESLQFRRYWQDEADAYDDPDKTVQWESSDPAIATVSQNGLVQAHRKGTVIISSRGDGGPGSATVIVR